MSIPIGFRVAMAVAGAGLFGGTLDAQAAGDAGQRYVDLGICRLENGETIEPCRIGYRTFGTLDEAGANAVLVPTWFGGDSEALAGFIRPGGLVDPDRYFVIVADALGNGISSSPSNTSLPNDAPFPTLTIGDMVEAHRRLLVEHLDLDSLAGVVGISMGGMQVFEWIVRHPEFASAAVAIAGTPRVGAYDSAAWLGYLSLMRLIESRAGTDAQIALASLEYMRGTSPAFVNRTVDRDSLPGLLGELERTRVEDADRVDLVAQAKAVASFDVSRGAGLEAAAARVRARLTVIVTRSDHQVTPEAAIEFTELAGGDLIVLENDCGHAGANCDARRALSAVAAGLAPAAEAGPAVRKPDR